MKFKVGDKVKCMNSGDWVILEKAKKEGTIFTVKYVDEEMIGITSNNSQWKAKRFELAKPKKITNWEEEIKNDT